MHAKSSRKAAWKVVELLMTIKEMCQQQNCRMAQNGGEEGCGWRRCCFEITSSFLEWIFSRVQPKRVNIAWAPRGCCKFIKRDSLTRSSSATTTVTHTGFVCRVETWYIPRFFFSTLLLSVYFSHLYQSHSLTSVFWHLIFAFLSSLNLLLVVYSSPWAPRASSSHARDLMKNNMAIVSGPWRRGWIFFCYIKKSRLNRMDVIPC